MSTAKEPAIFEVGVLPYRAAQNAPTTLLTVQRSSIRSDWHLRVSGVLRSKDFVDLSCQLEIQVADAANAVGIQIDHNFISHVEPFRVMVHRFRHQRHASHVSKGRHEILALERAMQLATF